MATLVMRVLMVISWRPRGDAATHISTSMVIEDAH